ncbi:MAG TPA: MFS transporter [Actinomycetes bacterium]|nr:MFS transporter [Actinomycetes bacterium]
MTLANDPGPAERLAARNRIRGLRPRIMNRELALVFIVSFGALTSLYLLLSVVALYAESVGAGGIGAGLATGVLLLSTVAAELATPRLMTRLGPRLSLGLGLVLLGGPALALPATRTTGGILAISAVRGVGFAIIVVVSGAMVASLVPNERRGEGLGLFGVVVGVPSIVALPLGVWLAKNVGYPPVFVAGAVAALATLVVIPGLPGRTAQSEQPVGILAGLRMSTLLRPSIVFATTAMAAGVVVTFLPLAVTGGSGNLAAMALFVQGATATAARWWAGRHGDRHGSAGLIIPGVLTSAAGMAALVLTSSPAAVIVAMVIFGIGWGFAQNASLALMFERVSPSGYGAVSALWNLAYDAGLGLGAAGFGLVAAQTGYPAAFALTAGVVLLAVVPAWPDRRSAQPAPADG